MCRYADLVEEAVQTLNNGCHLLRQITSVHGGCSAASSKSRCLNGPSSEEMPARNADAAAAVGPGRRGRSCDCISVFSIESPAGDDAVLGLSGGHVTSVGEVDVRGWGRWDGKRACGGAIAVAVLLTF